MIATRSCPACGGSTLRPLIRVRRDDAVMDLARCGDPECRLVFRTRVEGGPTSASGLLPPGLESAAWLGGALQHGLAETYPTGPLVLAAGEDRLGATLEATALQGRLERVEGPANRPAAARLLVGSTLLRASHPAHLLRDLLGSGGSRAGLILHVPRIEDPASQCRAPASRHLFQPEIVSYFDLYSLTALLWRSGWALDEWVLDDPPYMTVLATPADLSEPVQRAQLSRIGL